MAILLPDLFLVPLHLGCCPHTCWTPSSPKAWNACSRCTPAQRRGVVSNKTRIGGDSVARSTRSPTARGCCARTCSPVPYIACSSSTPVQSCRGGAASHQLQDHASCIAVSCLRFTHLQGIHLRRCGSRWQFANKCSSDPTAEAAADEVNCLSPRLLTTCFGFVACAGLYQQQAGAGLLPDGGGEDRCPPRGLCW